ncbi:endonuclease MutS2 [Pectinatus sottacetonis]|uniref:endonuclease MutS2 n=1 Tax=Pectinatus sottacetonis TaxID=1002795 RepID=UPI0018C49A06|nr:endonuclease MutS2 [Pectinatus sottacetonis]
MEQATLKVLQYNKILEQLSLHANTLQGKNRVSKLTPLADFEDICSSLQQTQEAYNIITEYQAPPFGGIFDIQKDLQKAHMGMILSPQSLMNIASTMYGMRNIKHFFKECPVACIDLKTWAVSIEILGQLERNINNIIDEHGSIKDNASNDLARIRNNIKISQSQVKSTINNILKNPDMQKFFQENIITIRDDRYVIPIKQEYRQYFPGIIHDQSASGSTLFIEPMTIAALNNDIRRYKLNEKKEIERILKAISAEIAENVSTLQQNCEHITNMDIAFAKAGLGRKMNACMPILNERGYTELTAARHPLIDQKQVVPINIVLGKNYRTLLITGPNTGGKTISLKTMGLLVLMAQSGLFIPAADGSQLGFYRNIFADIGDEQSIEQSLSTFSAHMTHIINILQTADSDDLVLLDELGSGTDPEEGASLAMAVLEKLMDINVSVIATTHYNELKTFAYSHDNIENASVEFDIKTLQPTYRLLIGIPGASNAFAISRRLGLDDSIIFRAKQLIKADHNNFENILNTLETEKLLYEQKNSAMAEKERYITHLERRLNEQKQELAHKKNLAIKNTKKECAAVIRDTRRQSEMIIKELKLQFNDTGKKNRQNAIDAARQKLQMQADKFNDITNNQQLKGTAVDLQTIAPGDIVFLKTLQQQATVHEIKNNKLVLLLGGLKTTVDISKCSFISHSKEGKCPTVITTAKKTFSQLAKTSHIKRQIDIRGMMVSDAAELLDKYIDDALLAGLKQIIIIHGKGTGALRKGIHEYLKNHRNVLDFSLADINEGGSGATVVQLR